MTVESLIANLADLGVQILADGDRLRFWPRSAASPSLLEQMKVHKVELLESVRSAGTSTNEPEPKTHAECFDQDDPFEDWIELVNADGTIVWIHSRYIHAEIVDRPDPCLKCQSLTFWWNESGDTRCLNCAPPARRPYLICGDQPSTSGHETSGDNAAGELMASSDTLNPCYWCDGVTYWRSIHGREICGNCHPPAVTEMAVEWLMAGLGDTGAAVALAAENGREASE